ncbi:MAG: Ig-like domain-containing protein [Solirubrobacteraceae bacterium]
MLLALLMSVASLGSVADAATLSFQPAFSPSQFLGEGSTLNAQFTFTGSEYHGSPDPVTEVMVHLPAGVGGSSAGFPTCSEQTLHESGSAGCPAGSLAGPVGSIGLDIEEGQSQPGGVIVIERIHETGTIQPVFADKEKTNDDFFFYIEAPGVQAVAPAYSVEDTSPYGRMLRLELPLIESIPAQPFASITSLTLTLGTSREENAQLVSSLTIPQECPVSGMFPWAADVTYTTNGTFTEQTHEHMTAETVCPASSGRSATTTTLQASPASPHVGEVVSYTATVTPKTLGASMPSGSVTFLDEGQPITGCTTQALVPGAASSTASCQLSYPASGTHQVTVRYDGDSGYFGSESATQAITVSVVELPHEAPKEPKPPLVVSCCDGPVLAPPISVAQLKALLARQLVPSGKAATIPALLKHGGYSFSFAAPEAGGLTVQWYELPKGAKLAGHTKAKPVLVASGKVTFQAAGTGKLNLRLTSAGRRVLRHAKRMTLTAKGTFAPRSGAIVNVATGFTLKR